MGDFIISHLGSYSGEKSRFEAEVRSDTDSWSALRATSGEPKGYSLSHGAEGNGGSAVYSAGPPMAAGRGTYSQLGWAAGRGDAVLGLNRQTKWWERLVGQCQGTRWALVGLVMSQCQGEPAFGGSRGGGRPPAGESTVRLAASSMIPTGRQEVERGRGREAGQASTEQGWMGRAGALV